MTSPTLPRAVVRLARSTDAGFVLLQLLLSRLLFIIPGMLTAGVVAARDHGDISIADVLGMAPSVAHDLLCNADCGWYQAIVAGGYHAGPFAVDQQYNWAFFPLYPGLTALAGGTLFAGIAISTIAAAVACLVLSREVRARYGRSAARWTILFLLYWPMSGVLTAYRPEALVLLGTVIAWSAAGQQRWLIAWLGVAIATASRPTGAFAAVLVAGEILRLYRLGARRPLLALAGVVLPLGTALAFMAYLYALTGNALAWSDIQVAWGRVSPNPAAWAERYLVTPWFIHWDWDFTLVNIVALVIGLLAGLRLWVRHNWALGTFTFLSVLTSPITGGQLISICRYAATTFTLPLVGGTDRRLRHMRMALLVTSAVGLALIGAWLALGSKAAAA